MYKLQGQAFQPDPAANDQTVRLESLTYGLRGLCSRSIPPGRLTACR